MKTLPKHALNDCLSLESKGRRISIYRDGNKIQLSAWVMSSSGTNDGWWPKSMTFDELFSHIKCLKGDEE